MIDTLNMPAAFDAIRDIVAESFATGGEAMVADMRQMISVPVTYTVGKRGGKKAQRSVTPEPPRKDTGALYDSIAKAVEVGLYGIEMAIFTDKPYSAKLQSTDYISGPRLHWSTLNETWQESLPELVAADLEARTH